ncbi:MAG: pantoate--beta-alanine ligase [Thermoguttaceae bacterium]
MYRRKEVLTTVAGLREALAPARQAGRKIGLVPTMGALHEGHLSLVRAAKAECDVTVATIYVNPSQFGAGEDLAKYPRPLKADLKKLVQCNADVVFTPPDEEVYGPSHATWVEVGAVSQPLEGQFRPGHFRGVATVVLKLFQMAQPDLAYFGQKDYQQALVIRRMTADLDLPVAIRVLPIVREPDGLAMSSRNAYLSPAARQRATVLWKSLQLAGELVGRGERSTDAILRRMHEVVAAAGDARVDYIALVDPQTLLPVGRLQGPTMAMLAVWIENTRLIDNCVLEAEVRR